MSSAEPSGARTVPTQTMLIRSSEQKVRYDLLPGADAEGTRRGVANGIAGTSCMVNLLEMPAHQTSPTRSFNGEHVVYQLSGHVIWAVADTEYALATGDMLFIPADVPYSFRNDSESTARFLDIAGKTDAWPPSMSYDDGQRLESESMGKLFN